MRVKIEPIDQWVNVTVSELLSPDARSKAVASFARVQFRAAQDTNRAALGNEPPFEQFVDGRKGAMLESVNPDKGRIVFEFELVGDVVKWIMTELIRRSPRGPAGGAGTYREQHALLVDGVEMPIRGEMPVGSEFMIVNTTPYARKIEIGTTKAGRPFVINAEPRLYDRVSHEAAARFSRVAKISYTFRPLAGGARVRGRSGPRDMRYPTIFVRPH